MHYSPVTTGRCRCPAARAANRAVLNSSMVEPRTAAAGHCERTVRNTAATSDTSRGGPVHKDGWRAVRCWRIFLSNAHMHGWQAAAAAAQQRCTLTCPGCLSAMKSRAHAAGLVQPHSLARSQPTHALRWWGRCTRRHSRLHAKQPTRTSRRPHPATKTACPLEQPVVRCHH